MRNKTNTCPELPKEFLFLEDYNGYYADKSVSEDNKKIYLTFDAGYENGNVEKILDIMKKHNAKGSFFVLENLIVKNTELVKRMANEGHLVCNHTCKHKDMSKIVDKNEFQEELLKLEELYTEYTGNTLSKFYRPPEGRFTKENLIWASELGYKTILWSNAHADWDNNKQPNCEKSIEILKSNTHNGMILLLHPTSSTNVQILDKLLTDWENDGYSFCALSELK